MGKRIIGLCLVVVLLFGLVPSFVMPVEADTLEQPTFTRGVATYAELESRLNTLISRHDGTYWTKNGNPSTDYTDSKYYYGWQCKGFAGYIFNELFCGGYIGPYDSNMYYIPNPTNATLVEKAWDFASSDVTTVKNILTQAQNGDFIQARRRGQTYGHSMIVAGKDANGIWIFDCNHSGTCDVDYYYQSYTTFAQKNSGMSLYHSTKYPELIQETYPAYCAIKVSSSTTYIKSLPCSEKTDANSTNVEVASSGDQYQAIGLVKNSAGNLWYKVKTKSGTTGYMYAGDTTYLAQSVNDLTATGVTVPKNHVAGQTYSLTGTISSSYNQLTGVTVYIHAGSNEQGTIMTGGSASVSKNSYSLSGSSVDGQTEFDILSAGTYSLHVLASYKNCYATSGTTYKTNTDTISLYFSSFSVANAPTSCSHAYNSTVTTEPTCISSGVRKYTCSKCGDSYTETIAEMGHSYGSWEIVKEPTCTTDGAEEQSCNNCSYVRSVAIAAYGHDYQSLYIPGDCVTPARTQYCCSICEDFYEIYDQNSYSEWSTEEPTGVPDEWIDYKIQYRSRIKETTTSTSSSLSGWIGDGTEEVWGEYGAWSEWSRDAVTASDYTQVEKKPMYRYYYFLCAGCGDHNPFSSACDCGCTENSWNATWSTITYTSSNSTVVSYSTKKRQTTSLGDGQLWYFSSGNLNDTAIGTIDTSSSAAVIEQGYRYRTRTKTTAYKYYRWGNWSDWVDYHIASSSSTEVESRALYRYLIAGDHNYKSVVTPATCITQGYTTYTCTVCNDSYKDDYTALKQHNYITEVVEPTCEDEGYTIHTCSDCGHYYRDQYVSVIEHVFVYSVSYKPTATEEGEIVGICSICNKVERQVLPILDTVNYSYKVVQEATCQREGVGCYTWKITDYGTFSFDISVDKINHQYSLTIGLPSCLNRGYTTYTCTACGYSYVSDYIDALGHDPQSAVCENVVEATCTAAGSYEEVVYCGRCDKELSRSKMTVPTKNHSYLSHTTAPTCSERGSTTYICTVCSHGYTGNYVAALGHDWVLTDSKEPTASEDGYKKYGCSRCDETKTETIPATGEIENPFTDVPAGAYYEKPVLWALKQGITGGTSATTFGSTQNCTREQVVMFLWNANGAPEPTLTKSPFTDVPAGKYYTKAVLWAYENGIAGGTSATTFGVGKEVTRAQFVTFLYNAMGKPEVTGTTSFTDVPANAYYAKPVLWAVQNGITGGTSATTFSPSKACTRAQVVTFLYQAYGKA